ncbi:MAG: phosphoribosyltransferase [Frankia sp.]
MFADRSEAGRALAALLTGYASRPDVVVLALPRGGVPVGFEVARSLDVPLDVFVVRKLGFPGHEELAMGALATGGTIVLNEPMRAAAGVDDEALRGVVAAELRELDRRERAYRGGRPPLDVADGIAILVDDGVATGATMTAALRALRERGAARLVAATPVGSPSSLTAISALADEVVCVSRPADFAAVGRFYADFGQTTDDQVRDLLTRASHRGAPEAHRLRRPPGPG